MRLPEFMIVYIGFDPREAQAYAVARNSILRKTNMPIPVRGLVLDDLREQGLYSRPTSRRKTRGGSQLWDDISDAPMATEFSCSRFLTPLLAKRGWALFMDCDMMVREPIANLFALADPKYAVMCVKHVHEPKNKTKMDDQIQTIYARKNWSSVMLFNCDHPANKKLTLDLVNSVPGRDLHRFCWLKDHQIGGLHPRWNYLVGHTKLEESVEPAIVHWTDGIPSMLGYENAEYADEYFQHLYRWAA